MAVASLLKKIELQERGFVNHPASKLDEETRINYLRGIALIANEDNDISKNEIEYLDILIKSLHLSHQQIKDILHFVKHPKAKSVYEIILTFQSNPVKYNFLLDSLAIADVDGHLDDEEEDLIEEYVSLLQITPQESEELYQIFHYLKKKEAEKLVELFAKSQFFKEEDFEYLINYYKLNLHIAKNFKRTDIKAFSFDFIKPHIRHGGLRDADELATHPINNFQFCLFLNAMYARELIEFDAENNIIATANKKLVLSKHNIHIQFKNNLFQPKRFTKKERLVYVSFNGALMFVEWLNELLDTQYKVTEIQSDKYDNLSVEEFHQYLVDGELYIQNGEYMTKTVKKGLLSLISHKKVELNYSSEHTCFRIMRKSSQN
ncbi:hypothetical protein MNB_SM-3-1450 [hydrothermal vent metagenome]|uniref:Co-chaperone DjlA N-terminal domain-containing protein n=1 Tax=hydrothermal vent metagenome TaxID=652676 RepID=A0A1W1D256_9ZZZZ